MDLQKVREDLAFYERWKRSNDRGQRRLSRAELLEVRRAAHENYLQRKLWEARREIGCSITIEGDEAVIRRREGFLTVRVPARELFAYDFIRRLFGL